MKVLVNFHLLFCYEENHETSISTLFPVFITLTMHGIFSFEEEKTNGTTPPPQDCPMPPISMKSLSALLSVSKMGKMLDIV